MKSNLTYLVQKLLSKNKIPFDKEELSFQIQSHPSYPSLHAITGVLDHFNIENIAADVPATSEVLQQLPNYFIAQVSNDSGSDLALVEKKKEKYIIYLSDNQKETVSEGKFIIKFTGIIVAVEKSEEEEKNNLKIKSSIGKNISIAILSLFAIAFIYLKGASLYTITYLTLSVIGFTASVAIIKQELGLKTTIGDAFCSGANDKKDCDAVLTSKGAEIIKGYKLSDFSLLYFSGLLLLTFTQIVNPVISFTFSLIAIPITLYSIYYQYVVVKKWCMLCLTIVGVLWLQALIPLLTNSYITTFITNDIIVFGLVSFTVLLTWNYLKPLITDVNQLKKEKIENVKFKRNYTLFESLLQKSSTIDTNIINGREIIFGNNDADLEITVITNPFCGHCKPVHSHIDEILHRYKNEVKIKVRFNINTQDLNSDAVKITSRLLELFETKGEAECLKAMDDIYSGETPENWFKKWGECIAVKTYNEELEKENTWCKDNAINFTPEILINGKSYPKEYNRSDLIFFIEDLHENTTTNTVINL